LERILVGTIGYYGRAIIRKYRSISSCEIVGIIDNDETIWGSKFWDIEVLNPNALKNLNFDSILIGGRDFNHIKQGLLNNFSFDESKVRRISKSDVKPCQKSLTMRNNEIKKILFFIKKILVSNNIFYTLDFSGLLSLKRGQLMSEFSDVEIAIFEKDLKKFLSVISNMPKKNDIRLSYATKKNSLYRKGDLIGIDIFSKKYNSHFIEPAVVSITVKKIRGKSAFYMNEHGKIFKYKSSHFIAAKTIKCDHLTLNTPLNSSKYLYQIYGSDWEIQSEFWSGRK